MTPAGARLVLASRSPQRRAILETLGVAFTVVPSSALEGTTGDPRELAVENALRKARAVADAGTAGDVAEAAVDGTAGPRAGAGAPANAGAPAAAGGPPRVVLGVDTVVALGGAVFGKPPDAGAARATLRSLSGARHTVVSGIALLGLDSRPRTTWAATDVQFARLDDALIDWYVDGGEWRERAGGYAIQGRGMALIERIDGDYSNVVGLPVPALLRLWPELLHAAAHVPGFCSDFCV